MIFLFARHNVATIVHCPGVEAPVWSTLGAVWKMRDRKVKALSVLRSILVNSLKIEETLENVCLAARKGILISDQPDCIILSWRRSLITGSMQIPFSRCSTQRLQLSAGIISSIWPWWGELRRQPAPPVHPVLLLYCTIMPKPAGT